MKESKDILVCDFDGTLINTDSERALIEFLKNHHFVNRKKYFIALISLPINYISRKLGGHDILRAWSAFESEDRIERMITIFLEEDDRISINKNVVSLITAFQGKRILLTGSYQCLVERILKKYNLDYLFDSVIGSSVSKNGVVVKRHPYGKEKEKYIPKTCAVGIGNEYQDRFFLERCKKVYIVNPDIKLTILSQNKKWTIIR